METNARGAASALTSLGSVPVEVHNRMRRPGFEPGLPDWQSDVLDQTGRPSH